MWGISKFETNDKTQMTKTTNINSGHRNSEVGERLACAGYRQRGVVLLVVLFVVMVITVLSMGFLAGSDSELACGRNMAAVSELDYLAESGLEHAKGLIISPQDIASEYWTGATGQQITAGEDYYDVRVVRDDSDPTDKCNYTIESEAYRMSGGERIGERALTAELRLDPCVALWLGSSSTISQQVSVHGDVYCAGSVLNLGHIDGDIFAAGSVSGVACSGSSNAMVAQAPVNRPNISVDDYYSTYYVDSTAYSPTIISSMYHPSGSFMPSAGNPGGVRYRGVIVLTGDTNVEGTLVSGDDLTSSGTNNTVTAVRNFPGLIVDRNLWIVGGDLEVNGFVYVGGSVYMESDSTRLTVNGGLYVGGKIYERAANTMNWPAYLYNGPTWQPTGGKVGGALQFDGVDDYAQTGNSWLQLKLSGDYTFSVWVKPASVQKSWAAILSKCDYWGTTNHWTLQFDSSNPKKLIVHHPSTTWDTGIRLSDIAGAWHHIGVVREGNQMTSYLDGVIRNSDSWSENPGSDGGHLNIGVDRTAEAAYTYAGGIDELRIYDAALDPSEVYPPRDGLASLIAHWRFDEAGAEMNIIAAPCKTAIRVWSGGTIKEQWQQAGGGFFKSIGRP